VVIQITDPDTDLDHDTGKTALVEVCSVLVLLVSYVTTLVIYSKCRDFLLRVSLRLTCNSRLVQHTKNFYIHYTQQPVTVEQLKKLKP